MKTLYLLVADTMRASLYKTDLPPGQLTLIYHQRNLGGTANQYLEGNGAQQKAGALAPTVDASLRADDEQFANSLCRVLRADFQAGKFDRLAVLTSAPFLVAIHHHVGDECGAVMMEKVVRLPTQLIESELIAHVQQLCAEAAGAIKPTPLKV